MSARERVLATVAEVAADPAGFVLLDVRWALGVTDGHDRYRAGHLPGAVHVDLDTELAAPPSPARGRHPLPDPADLQAAARRWGVRAGSRVVAYDAVGGTSAARAWWLLRQAGHADVRLLDGGLQAWEEAGLPLEAGDVVPVPGDVVVRPGAFAGPGVLDADGAQRLAHEGLLLDARAGERYRGEVEPVDPRAGHVPGAVSAPTTENLGPDGRFLDDAGLRARFAGLGLVPPADDPDAGAGPAGAEGVRVGVYCGSGVTAAHTVAALAAVGVDAALYAGSWSQWAHDAARPAAVGPRP